MQHIHLTQDDCVSVLQDMATNKIDITVTSPPYDNLRTYNDNKHFC